MQNPKRAKPDPGLFAHVPRREFARLLRLGEKTLSATESFLKTPPKDLSDTDTQSVRQMQAKLKEVLDTARDDSVILAAIATIDAWMAQAAEARMTTLRNHLPIFKDKD